MSSEHRPVDRDRPAKQRGYSTAELDRLYTARRKEILEDDAQRQDMGATMQPRAIKHLPQRKTGLPLTPTSQVGKFAPRESLYTSPQTPVMPSRHDEVRQEARKPVSSDASAPRPTSDQAFRFENLPASLQDDAYHHRQRAAQLILMCSQKATASQSPLLQRLSLSLTMSRPALQDDDRTPVPANLRPYSHEPLRSREPSCCGDDGSESEANQIDFDSCQSSHLCNKKKRKSGRSTSPVSTSVMALTPAGDADISHSRLRGLNQASSKARNKWSNGGQCTTIDSCTCESVGTHPTRQLPDSTLLWSLPRRTRWQKQRTILKAKARMRLINAHFRRGIEKSELEDEKKELTAELDRLQKEREAIEAAHALLSQDKKKRASKAERRSLAIRGSRTGSASLADIRARKTGNSTPPAANGAQTSPAATRTQVSVPANTSPTAAATATKAQPELPSKDSLAPPPVQSIEATMDSMVALTQQINQYFRFRQPSKVASSLDELRSQVLAAPKDASNDGFKGDLEELSHAMNTVSIEQTLQALPAKRPSDRARPTHVPAYSPPPKREPGAPASTSVIADIKTQVRKGDTPPVAPPKHTHTRACSHRHAPVSTGPFSALFTADDWICVFCEYELYYGKPSLMLRACNNRKKLVSRKNKTKAAISMFGAKHTHHHEHSQFCEHHSKNADAVHTPSSYDAAHEERHENHNHCDCGNSVHDSDVERSL